MKQGRNANQSAREQTIHKAAETAPGNFLVNDELVKVIVRRRVYACKQIATFEMRTGTEAPRDDVSFPVVHVMSMMSHTAKGEELTLVLPWLPARLSVPRNQPSELLGL